MDELPKLDDIIKGIEKKTALVFPDFLKDDVTAEKVDCKEMYDKYIDYLRSVDGKEPSAREKIDAKFGCITCMGLLMQADSPNKKIYVCEEAMDHQFDADADVLAPVLLAHELGHQYLHHSFPEILKMERRYSGKDEMRMERIDRMNEFFADYVMLKYAEDDMDVKAIDDYYSERIEYYFDRKWGNNNLLIAKSTDEVLNLIKKEIVAINK